jgi:Mn2+/Fe2+ NRAMP family transporter
MTNEDDSGPEEIGIALAEDARVAAAPFIVVTMFVSSNRTIMGEYVNGRATKFLGWLTAALMAVAAIALFATGGV